MYCPVCYLVDEFVESMVPSTSKNDAVDSTNHIIQLRQETKKNLLEANRMRWERWKRENPNECCYYEHYQPDEIRNVI
jgi:nitrate/TMAO reductase-like tetraheme cytochrome c subunit